MPRAPPPAFYLIAAITLFVWFVFITRHHDRDMTGLSYADRFKFGSPHYPVAPEAESPLIPTALETGTPLQAGNDGNGNEAIMGKLSNETLKAELGRAAWKLFHTTMAQFPDKPAADESKALKDYIHLFARLYPCGECARHFQQILAKYPPQVSSRSTAASWACFVHNEVNKSKNKPIFDCANIGEWYDCGCGDDKKKELSTAGQHAEKVVAGADPVEIQKEGLTRGD